MTDTVWNGLYITYLVLKVLIGFSIIIFVHELGHFLAAKWMRIRVDRFAIGFFHRLVGYRRGEGLTFGKRPNFKPDELAAKGYGETDYCLNALPFGGYVKMLGEDDVIVNEETGEVKATDDPRAFCNKSVGRRMVVVSAGVIFNVAFAILLYAFVYAGPGKTALAPVIGKMEPGSPAASAGLRLGDRVLAIGGQRVRSFDDIAMQCVLREGPLHVQVERGAQVLDQDFVLVRDAGDSPASALGGMWPGITTTLSENVTSSLVLQGLQPGDRITHVHGQPVENGLEIEVAFQGSHGRPVELTVVRAAPGHGSAEPFRHLLRPALRLEAAEGSADNGPRVAASDLLGFVRRRMVFAASPGSPAAAAGFKAGDVIAQWGNVANPHYRDITEVTGKNDGVPIVAIVERQGQPVSLTVTPRRSFHLFRSEPARVGLSFDVQEDARAVVADVIPGTPAAELGAPRGAELVAINDRPVGNWPEVLEALEAAAGTTVTVRYRSGKEEAEGRMAVPSSVVNELGLPATARIVSVGGESALKMESGRKVTRASIRTLRQLFEKNIGRTVPVEYAPSAVDLQRKTELFAVRADNVDAWQLRSTYGLELDNLGLFFVPRTEKLREGHPGRALVMAVDRTQEDLRGVYLIIRGVAKSLVASETSRVSVQNISGPVGIVRSAVQLAEAGIGELLFFLAYISVNLAVINFMPLPVVDGGLMLFLILEKIRGRPMSLKVQVITTLAGLALIVLSFVFVTFQDVAKWIGGTL